MPETVDGLMKDSFNSMKLESGPGGRPGRNDQSKKLSFKCINQFNDSNDDEEDQKKENNCHQSQTHQPKKKPTVIYKTAFGNSFHPSIVKHEAAV